MSSVLVSAKGQVVLPADLRRRLGLNPGARLEVTEEPDGLRLRVQRAVPTAEVSELAGMVTAPSRGKPRSLSNFDPASLTAKARR
jgi:AbrB family looped-hinge helix DNA binding protein